jgi:hypothetical protein
MGHQSPFPDRDVFGNPLRPGDVVTHDMLGRPVRVHPSRICRHCGEIRVSDDPVCAGCGAVSWRRPISATMTAVIFAGGAFWGRAELSSPWNSIAFWAGVVIGGLWALETLRLWNQALKGVGVEILRVVGGGLLFGGLGWLIDWWRVGALGKWAIIGAVAGASLELLAQQYYYLSDDPPY